MKQQTIFFDVGNVLVFFSHIQMIEKMADLYQSTFDKVLEFILKKNLQANYEIGSVTTSEVCQTLNERYKINALEINDKMGKPQWVKVCKKKTY